MLLETHQDDKCEIKHLYTNSEQYTTTLQEIILAYCTVAVDLMTVIMCIKYVFICI